MTHVGLAVVAVDGAVRHAARAEREVTLSWRGAYEPGDRLVVTCDDARVHLVMRLDACLAESHVLMVGGRFVFPIPFGESQCAYGKGWAFADERHWAYVRLEDGRERAAWRNLALNAHDLPCLDARGVRVIDGADMGGIRLGDAARKDFALSSAGAASALYPHASTNVVCLNPQFWARNAIDGVFEASCHGSWPHESWGVNGASDAWLRIDFGEQVRADELWVYLRADFPHDTWWDGMCVELSDGTNLPVSLSRTGERQCFDLGARKIAWLRLHSLHRAEAQGFPALAQVMVMGRAAAGDLEGE